MKRIFRGVCNYIKQICRKVDRWLVGIFDCAPTSYVELEILDNCTNSQRAKVWEFVELLGLYCGSLKIVDSDRISWEGITYAIIKMVDEGKTVQTIKLCQGSRADQESKIFI